MEDPPAIGQGYRGSDGHSGYLLRQAWHAFRGAMDDVLRDHGLTGAQYAVLSVLARQPGLSGADLARACNTTPQAMNGVLTTLERARLVERQPHPTHGRILQVDLTDDGRHRLEAATPGVRALEAGIEEGLSDADLAVVKRWLVAAAQSAGRAAAGGPRRPAPRQRPGWSSSP
jgi:DNA-binding MarR family transcriptional regulator